MDKNTSHPLIIAIDGYSSCGKSTLARQIAKKLTYVFVDTGAMYRAAALYFIENNIDLNDEAQVKIALDAINISFRPIDGVNVTLLNGRNVEEEIRSIKVSGLVSEVAALSAVRKKLVSLQRKIGGTHGVVMDGRDIGTVVFPDADLKFFITADPLVRAQRRYNELISKNISADLQEVLSNLAHRDKIDTEREDSPLVRADDAILIDNTHLTIDEQFDFVMQKIVSKLKEIRATT